MAVTIFGIGASAQEPTQIQTQCELDGAQAYFGIGDAMAIVEDELAALDSKNFDERDPVRLNRRSLERTLKRLQTANKMVLERMNSVDCQQK